MESRPLFGLERVWLAADRIAPPFVNQLVVEGDGELDPEAWRVAMLRVFAAWPAARARLRGILGFTRWADDGALPRVTTGDPDWDGRTPVDFTASALDPWAGPIVELVLASTRLVLRTHHAAFDGRAAWAFAEDLGRAARGEPVLGAAFAGLDDQRVATTATPEPPADAPVVLATDAPHTWARVTIPRVERGVLARALVALARAAGLEAPLRVSVPVDLRTAGERSAANLTGFARVEVARDADPDAIGEALARGRTRAGGALSAAHPLRNLPLAWMVSAGRDAAADALRSRRASVSATLSNLGRQDPGALAVPGFRPRRAFWIPPPAPASLFLTLTGHPEGVELCGSAPAPPEDLRALLERIAAEMSAPAR